MLIGSIAVFLAAILSLGLFLLPSLAMAQQQQQQTTTTPTPSSPSLSITTTPPLTPEEQGQQNRLQSVIAATTANLNETEKQVSGVVFTPRWSEPVWINANSIAVLIAYCLPGEFADSGQEILGGFELEVLESYAVALPQGFMAWMAVVGNEDIQNRRLPAALGVICASDLNNADTRVLSPQEQQQINNIIQQFTTIQNTQITNIEQVINIINNVTTTPPPPRNETGGGTTEQPLTVETIVNPTEAVAPATIMFDANVAGGTPPYEYSWEGTPFGVGGTVPDKSFTLQFTEPGSYGVGVTVSDSKGHIAYGEGVLITVEEPPPPGEGGVLLPPETGQEGQPLGGGLLPSTPPPPDDNGEVVSPPEGGESPPLETAPDEGDTVEEGGPPGGTTEEPTEGEEGEPPADEEPATPPRG